MHSLLFQIQYRTNMGTGNIYNVIHAVIVAYTRRNEKKHNKNPLKIRMKDDGG